MKSTEPALIAVLADKLGYPGTKFTASEKMEWIAALLVLI